MLDHTGAMYVTRRCGGRFCWRMDGKGPAGGRVVLSQRRGRMGRHCFSDRVVDNYRMYLTFDGARFILAGGGETRPSVCLANSRFLPKQLPKQLSCYNRAPGPTSTLLIFAISVSCCCRCCCEGVAVGGFSHSCFSCECFNVHGRCFGLGATLVDCCKAPLKYPRFASDRFSLNTVKFLVWGQKGVQEKKSSRRIGAAVLFTPASLRASAVPRHRHLQLATTTQDATLRNQRLHKPCRDRRSNKTHRQTNRTKKWHY